MVSGRLVAPVALGLFASFCAIKPVSAQFGLGNSPSFSLLMPKKVTLVSKFPSVFNAAGKSVTLQMASPNGQLQQMLDARILSEFTNDDSTLKVGVKNPDFLINCEVLQWQDPKYITVNDSTGSSKQLVGSLSVRFEIDDSKSRTIKRSGIAKQEVAQIVSRTINATSASKIFGKPMSGSPASTSDYKGMSQADAQQLLLEGVTKQIASYLVTTSQTLEIPLASGGALNNADKFAMGGLWTRDLELLETTPPYADPRVDAFRQYNIGVADEALAYQAQDTQAAIKYLQQASNAYGKALDARPEEKNFIPAQTRIKLALEHYEQIGQNSTIAATPPVPAPQTSEKPLVNGDIVEMVKAKLDQGNIVDTIQHASATAFDLSPQGLIALSKAGVNGQIISAMKVQQRNGAQR